MGDAEWIRKTLAEKFGITSEEDLNKALRSMETPDIGIFVNTPKRKAEGKVTMKCAS